MIATNAYLSEKSALLIILKSKSVAFFLQLFNPKRLLLNKSVFIL
jgi:hypothetical protein